MRNAPRANSRSKEPAWIRPGKEAVREIPQECMLPSESPSMKIFMQFEDRFDHCECFGKILLIETEIENRGQSPEH
jgi:hypothetical protein